MHFCFRVNSYCVEELLRCSRGEKIAQRILFREELNLVAVRKIEEQDEIDALVPVTSPVITEFARTGRIRFTAGGQVSNPPLAPLAKIAGSDARMS